MNSAQNHPNSDVPTTGSSVSASGGFDGIDPDPVAAENSVLNEIVQASGLNTQHAPDQQLLRAEFLQIAGMYQDIEFSVSPILTALVHAALGKLSGIDDTTVAQLEQFVANSIYENGETRARVSRFWDSLVKMVKASQR